ncbi:phosducin-like protein 3 [Salvelinus fontinalis]|uniref:phosducin-like protein 3 n=1 Tax=Salvelinus fontinalis TaxID=8038 RepID=UPI0024851330|nr:phosducin-like protein 3 [Salvelinus fontinalis]XP_055767205.1 phosducin-like protein 3 [Salvelinus fontinalis]XP_055767207.1 phosducin-like protein 3 [Salvelinus fontinalis]
MQSTTDLGPVVINHIELGQFSHPRPFLLLDPPLWVVKDREEDVEYQERSESEEGDEEEEEEEEYVCVIIEGSEVEEDEEEEEEEYEVTCVGEYVEEEEEEYEVTGVGEYVEEEEEEECLLEVVVKEEVVEEDEEERVETYEKEKNEKGENKEEEEEEDAEEEKAENKETVEEEEAEEEEGKVEEEEAEEEEQETTNTFPSVPMCSLLNHHFSHLATKFPECKFLMILAGQCVPNYPASHLPTLFIYESGCILNSLIGEKACGGRNVLEDELKWMLAQSGAFVIDSYEALYQEGTPITTPRSEQGQEDYSDDQSDHYDNQGTEV